MHAFRIYLLRAQSYAQFTITTSHAESNCTNYWNSVC